jgi:hypothetical protein
VPALNSARGHLVRSVAADEGHTAAPKASFANESRLTGVVLGAAVADGLHDLVTTVSMADPRSA